MYAKNRKFEYAHMGSDKKQITHVAAIVSFPIDPLYFLNLYGMIGLWT